MIRLRHYSWYCKPHLSTRDQQKGPRIDTIVANILVIQFKILPQSLKSFVINQYDSDPQSTNFMDNYCPQCSHAPIDTAQSMAAVGNNVDSMNLQFLVRQNRTQAQTGSPSNTSDLANDFFAGFASSENEKLSLKPRNG